MYLYFLYFSFVYFKIAWYHLTSSQPLLTALSKHSTHRYYFCFFISTCEVWKSVCADSICLPKRFGDFLPAPTYGRLAEIPEGLLAFFCHLKVLLYCSTSLWESYCLVLVQWIWCARYFRRDPRPPVHHDGLYLRTVFGSASVIICCLRLPCLDWHGEYQAYIGHICWFGNRFQSLKPSCCLIK